MILELVSFAEEDVWHKKLQSKPWVESIKHFKLIFILLNQITFHCLTSAISYSCSKQLCNILKCLRSHIMTGSGKGNLWVSILIWTSTIFILNLPRHCTQLSVTYANKAKPLHAWCIMICLLPNKCAHTCVNPVNGLNCLK